MWLIGLHVSTDNKALVCLAHILRGFISSQFSPKSSDQQSRLVQFHGANYIVPEHFQELFRHSSDLRGTTTTLQLSWTSCFCYFCFFCIDYGNAGRSVPPLIPNTKISYYCLFFLPIPLHWMTQAHYFCRRRWACMFTWSSLMETQVFGGKSWSIGTRNWRHPFQCPMRSIMAMRLKIRMNIPATLRNWRHTEQEKETKRKILERSKHNHSK